MEEDEEMENSFKDADSSKVDTLPQSDDVRLADMDFSDDGEKPYKSGVK